MDIISRDEARALGLKKYYTGVPCKYGHVTVRHTLSAACEKCKRLAGLKYLDNNRKRCQDRIREHRRANKERLNARARQRHSDNPEYNKVHARNWQTKNASRCREACSRYRASKRKACPQWVDRKELQFIYDTCPPGHHVDHTVPLKHPLVCGLHVPCNLKHMPARENRSKHNNFDPMTHVHVFPQQDPDERFESYDHEIVIRKAA